MKKITLFALLLILSCNKEKVTENYLGIVNINVTGSEEAIPYFEKGLLLLHSFEYNDAREAFLAAQKADPSMLMAYWGEAMTYNHSLWSEQDVDKGMNALEKLNLVVEEATVSELENDLISSVHVLYESDSSKVNRDKNYAKHMSNLYKKYPDNHEVAAFYALSLLGSVEDGRDDHIYGKGAQIAKGILEENPNHPGALHYLIHSYDDPEHAKLALDAADSYAVVAPDAAHALHMPSHIYVALGMWDKVVSSNENSYQASVDRMIAKNLSPNGRGFHSYHWLEYGYLQQGRVDDAKKMVLDMEGFTKENPNRYTRSHMVYLKGTYLSETDDWSGEISEIEVNTEDLNLTVRSQYRFLEGMKAFHTDDKTALDQVIDNLKKDLDKETYLVSYEDAPFCSGANRFTTSPSMLVKAEIMMYQLKALRSWMDDDEVMTETHFKKTLELEQKLSYSYGPPEIQKPTNELYADWLLLQGRTEDALAQYESALLKGPKRSRVLSGIENCKAVGSGQI
jgi:tetratricopeptide (TPR) repeat protein